MNRENKNGGGVALFIDNKNDYKVVEKMSTSVNNLLECVTIEIFMEKNKNVIVCELYIECLILI